MDEPIPASPYTITVVPEPSTVCLVVLSLGSLAFALHRKKRTAVNLQRRIKRKRPEITQIQLGRSKQLNQEGRSITRRGRKHEELMEDALRRVPFARSVVR